MDSLFDSIFGRPHIPTPDEFQRINCAICGQRFGIQKSLASVRKLDGGTVFCPNGHTLSIRPKAPAPMTEEEREKWRNKAQHNDPHAFDP